MDALSFTSHRSVLTCVSGCVASSQPLASQIGIDILKSGGNAADAAVAVAAALNVTEPTSTGLGGDAFCLFYNNETRKVQALNGSGRAPASLTLDYVNRQGYSLDNADDIPLNHGLTVTVPGAAAAWYDTVEKFGNRKLSLQEILKPAIDLAEGGFPVQKITANSWERGSSWLEEPSNKHGKDMLIDGKAPRHGQIMKLPKLAQTFKELGEKGKSGFYEGRIAQAICDTVQSHGGVMSVDDLQNHRSTFEEPISISYKGYRVWEVPPNGQGITALMALNILEDFDLKSLGHNTAEYLHILIEALRLSFADVICYCADPSAVQVPVEQMLSKTYAAERRKLIHSDRAIPEVSKGKLSSGSDTVYFCVTDKDGNACSFINSNYTGFGTGLVPEGCGFTLQNRGLNFSLDPSHPNVVAPNKRPYHTIIPAMVTSDKTGELLASYGVMGGFMQPQGHVQVLLNMAEFGMDPQQALDAPRFCVGHGHTMHIGSLEHTSTEKGVSMDVVRKLEKMGHIITSDVGGYDRSLFGRGQVIARGEWPFNPAPGKDQHVYWAGSDPRADGVAVGY